MLEQLKIDLMNLSRPKLLDIAKENKINVARTMNKEAIINILYDNLDDAELRKISKNYIYAGKTSVALWKYSIKSNAENNSENNTENKLEQPILGKSNIAEILTTLCEGENPFETARRPEVTKDPQIISANFLNDSMCRILFISLGVAKRAFEGYDYRTIYSTRFTNAVLNFDSQYLEVRTEYQTAKKAAEMFFARLNNIDGFNCMHKQLEIDLNKTIRLKQAVNGYMGKHVGKKINGEKLYDKVSVTKSPAVEDLWKINGFQDDLSSMKTVSSGIQFPSPFNADDTVSIDVSTSLNSIYFRSYASEGDINYVFEKLMSLSS